MKKILGLVLVVILMASLVACSGAQPTNTPSGEPKDDGKQINITNYVHIQNVYIYFDSKEDGGYILLSNDEEKLDGVYMIDQEEADIIISHLETYLLENAVDDKTKMFLESILGNIKNTSVVADTST